MSIINHGVWSPYKPDPFPEGAPPSALFFRSASGMDWYAYRSVAWPIDPDTLTDTSGTLKLVVTDGYVALANTNAYSVSLGVGGVLFEAPADSGIEEKWLYDAVSGLFSAPPIPPRVVYKADIWRRASEAEAETMDAMLNSQPVRLRRMWEDAVHLQSNDELFATIEAALTSAFGSERASELLA